MNYATALAATTGLIFSCCFAVVSSALMWRAIFRSFFHLAAAPGRENESGGIADVSQR